MRGRKQERMRQLILPLIPFPAASLFNLRIKNPMSKIIEIFTDGACKGNPGPGGWGAVLKYGAHEKQIYGGEKNTTNNRMEMTAVIKALQAINRESEIIITTDSQYVKNGITGWIKKWKTNNWKTAAKKPVKNVDLWKEMDVEVQKHTVSWVWVKGHDGHPENELADELANKGVESVSTE